MPVGAFGVFFLETARVREQDLEEVCRSAGAIDRTPKSPPRQQREIATVVDVGMRKQDGTQVRRLQRGRGPVSFPERLEALKEAAVEQDFPAAGDQQMLGAGDRAGGAEKRDRVRYFFILWLEPRLGEVVGSD